MHPSVAYPLATKDMGKVDDVDLAYENAVLAGADGIEAADAAAELNRRFANYFGDSSVRVEVDDTITIHAESGAFEDSKRPREQSDVATTAAIVQGIREARKSPAKQRSQFPTGFDRLDGMLGGGPRESHLVIVAAATSGGKTSLALNMGLNMAGQGIPAAMLSLEMARDELTMRGAAALSDGEDPDSGLNAIERLPFVISDNPDLSAEGARTMVKMLSARYGTKVVILDYLQLLRESGSRTSRAASKLRSVL